MMRRNDVSRWENLRRMRARLGLTMRDVEQASERIAQQHDNEEYLIPISRLSDFEIKGVIPSIYRLYSLAVIYRCDLRKIIGCYGVDLERSRTDLQAAAPHQRHRRGPLHTIQSDQMPASVDRKIDLKKTSHLGRMVEQWGPGPFLYLEELSKLDLTYGYIGSEDFTMYPILPPGTFVQVDELLNKVRSGGWRSERERPIYFVETRDSHTCCWCTVVREKIILEPHPLSPVPPRVVPNSEAEIIGQVVAVAMRLADSPPPVATRDRSGQPWG